MHFSTILPVLAILASAPSALSAGAPSHGNAHRRHLARAGAINHARAVERLATAVERREASPLNSSSNKEQKKRRVNRRGQNCKPRDINSGTATATEGADAGATAITSAAGDAGNTSIVSSQDPQSQSQATNGELDYYPSTPSSPYWQESPSPIQDQNWQTQPQPQSQSQWESQSGSQTQSQWWQSTTSSQNDWRWTQAQTTSAPAATDAASTSAAPAATTSAASGSGSANGQYTPNGKKAGIAGGDAYDLVKDYIGWWYDWSANPSGHEGTPIAVPMLWGAGGVDGTDSDRLNVFKAISSTPQYIMGFEEPDCSTEGSANVDVSTAVGLWDLLIGPWKAKGSILISPSMCHQAAEKYINWLGAFNQQISVPWDITNIHVNKNSMDGVREDIDYYWNTFGKPIWVTEFACVDDSSSFIPCTDQGEINDYINQIVQLFEGDERVHAYGYSNGMGLGDVWPMYRNGAMTPSGETYLSAISNIKH